MYRLSAFYFARSASDLPFEATPSLFVFIIYFMVRFCLCSMSLRIVSAMLLGKSESLQAASAVQGHFKS